MYYLGIDLGGTNIAVGIVDEENKIIARANSKTQTENAEQVADAMAETARKALESAGLTLADVPWIGVGSPGTINKSTGIIEFANNLPFKNTPMQEMLSQRLEGKQVLMENDANAAAFGEYMAGALKGSDNAIAITLGTGVGGGIIINHKIYSGSNFAGAELGHTVIVVDGRPCSCGRKGCWEAYASATGLIKTTKEHMADAPKDSPLWTLADGSMDNVNGRTAFDAMRQGDPVGKEVVDEYIKYFSVGLIIPVGACHILPQIVSDHDNKRLVSLRQPHFYHGRVKHGSGWLLLPHHFRHDPFFKAISQTVLPVHILKRLPLSVRHQGDPISLLLQLAKHLARPRNKFPPGNNSPFVEDLCAFVDNGISAVCKYDQIFIHSPALLESLIKDYQTQERISTHLLFFYPNTLHFLLLLRLFYGVLA